MRLPSTRDRIKLKKMIESGEYRARLNMISKRGNRSWEDIFSAKYEERNKYIMQGNCSLYHNHSVDVFDDD